MVTLFQQTKSLVFSHLVTFKAQANKCLPLNPQFHQPHQIAVILDKLEKLMEHAILVRNTKYPNLLLVVTVQWNVASLHAVEKIEKRLMVAELVQSVERDMSLQVAESSALIQILGKTTLYGQKIRSLRCHKLRSAKKILSVLIFKEKYSRWDFGSVKNAHFTPKLRQNFNVKEIHAQLTKSKGETDFVFNVEMELLLQLTKRVVKDHPNVLELSSRALMVDVIHVGRELYLQLMERNVLIQVRYKRHQLHKLQMLWLMLHVQRDK